MATKHTKDNFMKMMTRVSGTAKLRARKPGYCVAFATARIEGGKASVVIRPKIGDAERAIKTYSIATTANPKCDRQTTGYIWMENKQFHLFMKKGGFMTASSAFKDLAALLKASVKLRVEAETMDESQAAAIDQQDESELERELEAAAAEAEAEDGEDASGEAPSAQADAPPAPAAADDEDDDDDEFFDAVEEQPEEDAPEQPPEPEPQRPVSMELAENISRASQKASGDMGKIFKRAVGMENFDANAAARRLEDRLVAWAENLPEELREQYRDTAVTRATMSEIRNEVLGRVGRGDISEVLNGVDPDHAVGPQEVSLHFTDMATQLIRRIDETARIDTSKIESRVDAMIDMGQKAAETMLAVQRLSMVLVPLMTDKDALRKNFEGGKPQPIDQIAAGTLGAMDLQGTMLQALRMLNACQVAHENGLIEEEGKGLAPEEADFFERLSDSLYEMTTGYTDQLESVGAATADGKKPDPDQIKALLQGAADLRGFVRTNFARTDNAELEPTNVSGLYTASLSRLEPQLQAML